MSFLGDLFRDFGDKVSGFNPIWGWTAKGLGKVVDFVAEIVVEIVDWILDVFFTIIGGLLWLCDKVVSIFLPTAEQHAEDEAKKEIDLGRKAKEIIDNMSPAEREKNKNRIEAMKAFIREGEEKAKEHEAQRDLYRKLMAKGANQLELPISNGQVDTSKMKTVNNTAASRDPRIAEEHGKEGIKVYQH